MSNVCYLFSVQEGKTDDIQELRNKIMEVLRQEPYMGEKIPVRLIIYNIVLFVGLCLGIVALTLVEKK